MLFDFLVECTLLEEIEVKIEAGATVPVGAGNLWTLHVNGASNIGGSRAEMILVSSDGIITEEALHFSFKTLNNDAEYEALLVGLRLVCELGVQHRKAFNGSQLVVSQICKSTRSKLPPWRSTYG